MRHAADTDEGMESEDHVIQCDVLKASLEQHLADRDDVYIGGNVPLYFSALQVKSRDFRVPDIMVVLEARPDPERPFWVVWNEGGRVPNVVIEIVSPSTEETDRTTKHRIYSKVLGVQEYFIHDIHAGALEGYRLEGDKRYTAIAPDAEGRFETQQLGGAFGVVREAIKGRVRGWMRLFDGDGRVIATRAEAEAQRAEEASQRAEEERQRAEEASQRAEEASQRAEEERQRAEEERQRAEEERQRAEEERQRAEELTARLAEYERRFGELD